MKCVIIYFSQTGNTEMIAKAIQKGVKNAVGHCDIIKIKDANPRRLHEYDLIGIGSPVFGAEPDNVKIFINNMRFVGSKHAFVFSTHGSVPDFFFPSIIPRLHSRGVTVIGTGDWYGDCTLYHHNDPYPTKGHPDSIDLKEAKAFGREMVERSKKIAKGDTGLIPPVPPPLPSPKPGFNIIQKFPSMIKFHKDKCLYPNCRLCMDNCPMDGIDLTITPPVIAKPCENCEWCARICPTGALDILDWLEEFDAATAGAGTITNDFLLMHLNKAEAEGRFRRLLPMNLVGTVKNYKRRRKHPQWIIGKGLQPPDSD